MLRDGNLRSPLQQIEHCLPRQRGNVSLSNLQVLNAILYVAEHGCKWRGLPPRFGRWHTIYTRMNRWSRNGVLDRVFTELQRAQIIRVRIEAVSLDSTIVKVHPDGTGALKNGPQAIGKSRGGWTTKIHMVAADARTAITFALSPGQAGDAPHGRALLERLGPPNRPLHLLMDKAYEGNETRQLALDLKLHSGRSSVEHARRALGIRPRDVQTSQRSRAAVPSIEGFSSHLLALRQTRSDVHCLYQLRPDRRSPSLV